MGHPKVTVLMSVYNGERFLREAIESILNQTYKCFEFLIINDGSTDRSREIILSYNDPRIRLADNKQNIGLTRSLNKGLGLAEGGYIARMDADDISMPERLEIQFEYMEANPNIGLVGSYYLIIDEDRKPINKLAQDNLPLNHKDLVKHHFRTHYVIGTCFYRKSIVDYVGMYDEDFRYTQDMDFLLRVSERFEIANLPRVLYKCTIWRNTITSKHGDLQRRYKYLAISKALLRKAEKVSETALDSCIFEKLFSGYYRVVAGYLRWRYRLDELTKKD